MSNLKWHIDEIDTFSGIESWPGPKAEKMLKILKNLPTDIRFYVFNKPVHFVYFDNEYMTGNNLDTDIGTVMCTLQEEDIPKYVIVFEDSELEDVYVIHESVHNAYEHVDHDTKKQMFEYAMMDARKIVDFVWSSSNKDVLRIKKIMKGSITGLTESNDELFEFFRDEYKRKTGREITGKIGTDRSLRLSIITEILNLAYFYRYASKLVDVNIDNIQFLIVTISRHLLDIHNKQIPKYLSDEEIVAWLCSYDRESSRDFFIIANKELKGPLGIYS